MSFYRMSEVRPYAPDSREADNARLLHEELGLLAARAFYAVPACNLILSAGYVYGDRKRPLHIVNDPRDAKPRYCYEAGREVIGCAVSPFAVLSDLVCAPHQPEQGSVAVLGVIQIAQLSTLLSVTQFDQEFTERTACAEGRRLEAMYATLFGPQSPFTPYWPVNMP